MSMVGQTPTSWTFFEDFWTYLNIPVIERSRSNEVQKDVH